MTCLIMTLDEMLKLALGTTCPDPTNIAVLYSFLKIFIKKMGVDTDFVEADGREAAELRLLLNRAKNPPIEFKTSSDDGEYSGKDRISKMEADIESLNKGIEKVEENLKVHLEAVELCKKTPVVGPISLRKGKRTPEEESFSSDCEDLCVPCDEKNLIACDLLQNKFFLKKLMRRITAPVVDRIFEFEKAIELLNEKFQNFLNTAEDEYRKIPLIEDALAQIESLKTEFNKHLEEFIATMEEIQEMLDAKVDKLHIPPLKKYLTDRMDEIEKRLTALERKEECPKAAGVIMAEMQCLCCTTRVCQRDRVYAVPLLASVAQRDAPKTVKGKEMGLCIPADKERACGGDHTVIRPGEKRLLKSNLIDDFGDKLNLRVGSDNVEYFKGLDGGMYRLAPVADVPCKGTL